MDTYYDDRRWTQLLAFPVVLVVVGTGLLVFLRAGDGARPVLGNQVIAAEAAAGSPQPEDPPTSAPTLDAPPPSTLPPPSTPSTASTASAASVPEAPTPPPTTTPPATVPTETSSPAPTTAPTTMPTTAPTTAPTGALGYPAAPDGTPLPIVATYDVGRVTLTGHVPSEAARDHLIALAGANSQDAAEVTDRLIVNAAVPANVGVRVIETNSPRFPDGEATITAAHAEQLDRVAAVMQALPHVTLLVIGHADQRGDEETNFRLSQQRAAAVVDYLVYLGVAPTRVASRAAGESDLLTLDDDAAALALNRRTEFVFYGVLAN